MLAYVQLFLRGSLCVVLFFITGCFKYHQLIKTEFPQGNDKQCSSKVKNYLKTVSIYDEFKTLAIFDILWLSDIVRTEYVDSYSLRRGKSTIGQEVLLRRQIEENKHWISFYLLADIRDKTNMRLNEKLSYWTMFLRFSNNHMLEPISIKEVELDPEYQLFFGNRFNSFKTIYLVKFPAEDLEENSYIQEAGSFEFVIAAPNKEASVSWNMSSAIQSDKLAENNRYEEDFYWG